MTADGVRGPDCIGARRMDESAAKQSDFSRRVGRNTLFVTAFPSRNLSDWHIQVLFSLSIQNVFTQSVHTGDCVASAGYYSISRQIQHSARDG